MPPIIFDLLSLGHVVVDFTRRFCFLFAVHLLDVPLASAREKEETPSIL